MDQVDDGPAREEASRGGRASAAERDAAAAQCDGGAADDDAHAHPTTASPPDNVVKLNVDGARFETLRAVLVKVEDSMLGRMFSPPCDAMLQLDPVDGSIFIDRDGEQFGLILDFLRGDPPNGPRMQRKIRALPETAQEALVQELDYFGLETAVFGLPPWTDDAAFRPGPAMGSARSRCAAVATGGRAVIFGGSAGGSSLDSTLLLDTQTMTFTAGPNLLTRREEFVAVQVDADRVLFVGGFDGGLGAFSGGILNTTEIFHLSTLTLTPGPKMQSPRVSCADVTLDARRILVAGGSFGVSYLSTTEIFNLDTMAFTPGPAMATPRYGSAAVALDEHRIMVTGGDSRPVRLNTTEILDVRTMAFTPGPSMGSARYGCAAVSVDAHHVLVIGGLDSAGTSLATTELLDVETMEFETGPAMHAARNGVAAVRLDAARGPQILVFGGYYNGDLSTTEVLAAES